MKVYRWVFKFSVNLDDQLLAISISLLKRINVMKVLSCKPQMSSELTFFLLLQAFLKLALFMLLFRGWISEQLVVCVHLY